MRKFALAICAAALATACSQKPAAPVSEAEAAPVVDAMQQALQSGDLAKVDALYTSDVVNIDVGAPGLNQGSDAIHKLNEQFVAMKFDAVEFTEKKIVPLGPDVFAVSGVGHFTSSTGAVKQADIRFTEVFRKQQDGSWKIAIEHISFPPPVNGG